MNKRLIFAVLILLISLPITSFADTLILTEMSRGEYENGKFSKGKPEFIFRIEINEGENTAKLTEITRIRDKTIISSTANFTIIYIEDSSEFNNALREKSKYDQRILVLVGKPGTKAVEVIMIGEDFFEYSKASSGRFYVSSGKVQKAISEAEDIYKQLDK